MSVLERLDRIKQRPMLSDWVPIEDYIKEQIRLLTGGGVWASYEVEGIAAETATGEALVQWVDTINTTLRNVCDDRLILKVKFGRGLASPADWPHHACDNPFLEDLLHSYRDRLLDRALYENRIFLGLEYLPTTPGTEWLNQKVTDGGPRVRSAETVQQRVDSLERCCSLLEASLSGFGLRRLGMAARGRGIFDEMLEAEAFIATNVWRQIPVTKGRPADAMFSEDVTFHHEHIEIRAPGSTTYGAHLGFKTYPASTFPGVLGAFLAAPFRLSLVHSFRFMEQAEGQSVLGRKQNKLVWANDKASSQVAALGRAADQLQSGDFVMGDSAMTLCVFADRAGSGFQFYDRLVAQAKSAVTRWGLPDRAVEVFDSAIQAVVGRPGSNPLSDVVSAAWQALGTCGCTVARENKALMGAWLSMLPGNDKHRPRPGAITSINYSHFNPLHNYGKGPEESRWGEAVAITVTPGGTPYRFHWHEGPTESASGGTLITGKTGSGKTLGTGFFIANTVARTWQSGGGWVGLDHKRGWNALTLAMGGSYSILGDGEPNFAPMKALPNTERSREFLLELLRGCIIGNTHYEISAEDEHRLELGVETVMQGPPEDRWVREVQAFLGDNPEGAGARLKKWCWGEELGWVIDAPADHIDMDGDINAFDTTRLLANKRARATAMLYLFFRIELRMNGQPLLISVDEGWHAVMEEEASKPAIEKISRTIRSKNGVLVFITQSPSDIVQAGMSAALLEQFPNQHHYHNSGVRREVFVNALGRTDGEYDALMSLQPGTGQFLMIKGGKSSIQGTPLAGLDDLIAILSTSEANLEAIDGMSPDDRADPVRFQAEFHRRRKLIAERGRRKRQRQMETIV